MYNSAELSTIRKVISRDLGISQKQKERLLSKYRQNPCGGNHIPLFPLLELEPALWEKVKNDKRVGDFSIFCLFPATYELFYGKEISPKIEVRNGSTREMIVTVDHPDSKLVIKPLQTSREHETAFDADRLGTGPRQLETISGFITEQFIEGKFFSSLAGVSDEALHNIGVRMGEILTPLHKNGIYYNDNTLSDDMGRSHVIVPENRPAILFDYGVSIRLDKYPNFTPEETFNYVRTIPGPNMEIQMMQLDGVPINELHDMVNKAYGRSLASTPKKEIFARDVYFINEGLWLASGRLDRDMAPFAEGFKNSYSPPE